MPECHLLARARAAAGRAADSSAATRRAGRVNGGRAVSQHGRMGLIGGCARSRRHRRCCGRRKHETDGAEPRSAFAADGGSHELPFTEMCRMPFEQGSRPVVPWPESRCDDADPRKAQGHLARDSYAFGLSHPLGADLVVTPLDGRPCDAKCRVFSLVVLRERVVERRAKDVLRMGGEVRTDGRRKIVVAGVGHGRHRGSPSRTRPRWHAASATAPFGVCR